MTIIHTPNAVASTPWARRAFRFERHNRSPVITDDTTQGYAPGSAWWDYVRDRLHYCAAADEGLADWREVAEDEIAFRTTFSGEFQANTVTKTGAALRWDMGDGTHYVANRPAHTYSDATAKRVRIVSPDGWLGLTYLQVSSRNLVGPIDPRLGQLGNLQNLYLHLNQLTGPIPAELGQLGELTRLYLYSNQLIGPIPAELGQLGNLRLLYLYSNQLIGPIPVELGQLGELRNFLLDRNQLTGSIPAELSGLTSLVFCRLYSNQLSGYTVGAFATQLSCTEYTIQDNDLSSTDVDNILADLVTNQGNRPGNSPVATVDLRNNAPPTATGIGHRDTLLAAGWTVDVDPSE